MFENMLSYSILRRNHGIKIVKFLDKRQIYLVRRYDMNDRFIKFILLGNAALQKFVEIRPEDAKVNKEAIENIAMKKAMVYDK